MKETEKGEIMVDNTVDAETTSLEEVIDNHQTQRFIVDIMEGGDEAFNRRKNN